MKRILITGSNGFLGCHLAEYFCRLGLRVAGVDRTISSKATHWKQESFPIDSNDFISFLKDFRPEALIHAAGGSSVQNSVQFPAKDFANGPQLTFTILNALREFAPSTKMIFLSSAAIYGQPLNLPVCEDAPYAPLSPYGYHKMICEQLCREFFSTYGIRSASARIFSAYGINLQKQVVWDLFRKISEGGEVTLQGTGKESRDFIHATDISRAVDIILNKGELSGEVYNVATGIETSIFDLAKEIQMAMGTNVPIKFDEKTPRGNPLNWRADISRLIKLGFSPGISLKQGIREIALRFLN